MRLAFDTNLLVYAEGMGDARRCSAANALVLRLLDADVVVPVQVLGELFRVLVGKYRVPAPQVKAVVDRWAATHATEATTLAAMRAAFELCADHGLSIWDSLILAVAAQGGCAVLLSEDMQHGFSWRGVTVVDPFAEPAHPLLLVH